ncbi:MAG: cyclic nucleotide-binding domain-containing protein [Fidelibacterota bacterium]
MNPGKKRSNRPWPKRKKKIIARLLQVERGESRSVFAFFLGFFFLISALVVGKTARDTLFLSRFDPAFLPHMYVAVAVAIGTVVALYNRLTRGVSQIRVAMATFALGAVSFLIIQSVLSRWVYPILYVWMDVIGTLCVIQFWFLTGRAFNARQAKRLFGIIGSGGALANTAVGFAIRPFVGVFGTAPLLTLTSAFLLLSLISVVYLKQFLPDHPPVAKRPARERKSDPGGLFKRPYLITIAVAVALSALVSSLVDYQLKIIASRTLDESSLASLFGLLYGIIGVASVIMQFFVTGRILTHLGIAWGLTFLPAALIMGNVMVLAFPVIMSAVMARAGDQIFRFTLHDASTQLLWVPVPMSEKKRTKPIIDGTIKNAAQGVSGILILAITSLVDVRYLSIPSLIFLAAWILSNDRLKKGYVHQLEKAIRKRQLNFETLQVDHTNPLVVKALRRTLRTGDDAQILFVLNTMKDLPLAPWAEDLGSLFESASPRVRAEILRLARKEPEVIPDEAVMASVSSSHDVVASEAMTVCGERNIAGSRESLERILTFASNNRPLRRSGAASGLILMTQNSHQKARSVLDDMLVHPDPPVQVAVLQLSASWRSASLVSLQTLMSLLGSQSPDVRNEAIHVASRRLDPNLIPSLADCLSDPSTRPAARRALRNFESSKVSTVLAHRLRDPGIPPMMATGILRCLGDHPSDQVRDVLMEKLTSSEGTVAQESADVLGKMVQVTPLSPTQVRTVEISLDKQVRQLYRTLSLLAAFEDEEEAFLVRDLLNHRIQKGKIHALKLSLLPYPEAPVRSLTAALASSDRTALPNVLEILDTLLSRENRRKLLPFFDPSSPPVHSEDPGLRETTLVKWAKSGDRWTSAVALHTILTPRFISHLADLTWEEVSRSPLQREMVSKRWDRYGLTVESLPGFSKPSWIMEDIPMYTTLEKTIFMKGVDLFRDIPGEEVSHVAQIAEEVVCPSGKDIFDEGDAGDSMYIIMNGTVRIHKNDKEIAVLREGEFMGEMAVLDQESRSATATATDDTVLLEITGEDFYDLLASRMEIMQAIVRVLTTRLRQSITS